MQIKVPELQLRNWLCHIHLPFLHALPADESIEIINKEHHKSNDHGQKADILSRCHCPQDDQHHIVGGIGQGEVGTAAEGQVYGNKAGGHGQGAGDHVGGVKVIQNELENKGHHRGQHI